MENFLRNIVREMLYKVIISCKMNSVYKCAQLLVCNMSEYSLIFEKQEDLRIIYQKF